MNNYKIGILGTGSIGRRHIKNISNLLKHKGKRFTLDLLRRKNSLPIKDDLLDYVNEIVFENEIENNQYDIIFICNPTVYHYKSIKKHINHTKHMFIEKPVFHDLNLEVEKLCLKKDSIYYVACPLRYSFAIRYVKEHVDISKVYSVRSICSSYLPDWRKDIDYRETYSAKRNEGGGVSIDLIHEWDYIRYIFGDPEYTYNLSGKYSNLEIDSDDISVYIAEFKNMLLELHLDYFGRYYRRELELFMENEVILVDILNSKIVKTSNNETVSLEEDRNDYQLKELEYFFDILEGNRKNHNNIYEALKTQSIAMQGEFT